MAEQLDVVFGALADPTRRAILARLAQGDLPVGELAAPFPISQPAISRHLKVLETAGLISRTRRATARLSHLEPEPLREATEWLARYRQLWEESDAWTSCSSRSLQRRRRIPGQHAGRTRPVMTRSAAPLTITADPGLPFIDMSECSTRRATSCSAATPSRSSSSSGWGRSTSDDGRRVGLPRRWSLALRPQRGERDRVRVPRRLPRRADAGRAAPDVRVRGRRRATCRSTASSSSRRRATLVRGHSVFQTVEARDAMIEHGMEGGMAEGYDQLDALVARLRAN